jgi:hypothetical protein
MVTCPKAHFDDLAIGRQIPNSSRLCVCLLSSTMRCGRSSFSLPRLTGRGRFRVHLRESQHDNKATASGRKLLTCLRFVLVSIMHVALSNVSRSLGRFEYRPLCREPAQKGLKCPGKRKGSQRRKTANRCDGNADRRRSALTTISGNLCGSGISFFCYVDKRADQIIVSRSLRTFHTGLRRRSPRVD